MTQTAFKLSVVAVLFLYLVVCVFWQRPRTDFGKLALKLCLANVVSWIILLPFDSRGHPPPQLIVGAILWLVNMPLLIAISVVLSVSYKSRKENTVYLMAASLYVVLNFLVICIIPAILLILRA